MSDSINEQRCERNGLPISGCAASEYDCAKFGVCAASPSVVTPPAQDEQRYEPPTLHQCLSNEGFPPHQRDRAARAFSRWLGTWRQDASVDEAALDKLQRMIGLGR